MPRSITKLTGLLVWFLLKNSFNGQTRGNAVWQAPSKRKAAQFALYSLNSALHVIGSVVRKLCLAMPIAQDIKEEHEHGDDPAVNRGECAIAHSLQSMDAIRGVSVLLGWCVCCVVARCCVSAL